MAKSLKKAQGRKWKHKVFVATPAYDGKVDTDYAVSLAESSMYAVDRDIFVQSTVMGNGAFIELARNTFVQMFLKSDCTHLFFIDADLRWEPRAFIGLIESERDVCAGVYRRRQEPETYPVRYVESPEGGIDVVDGGWVECERVPTGFLCIKRHVIEKMVQACRERDNGFWKVAGQEDVPALFYTQITPDGQFMGEDYSWCDDYVSAFGENIYVWPDFDFTHGGYKCNWHEYMNRIVAEQDAAETSAA